jgi:hypothetical protein
VRFVTTEKYHFINVRKFAVTLWKDIVLPTRNRQQGNKMNASPAPVSANQALFPDIELNNGIAEKGSSEISFSNSDPLAPRKRFRLFNGEFTSPVVVQEKTDMILFASLPQLGAVAAMLPLDVIYFFDTKNPKLLNNFHS